MWLTDMQKIGVRLTSRGALFMLLGVMLFFDGALLALGNILFLGGLFLIIDPQKTFYFFARKNKLCGTACFLGGILLVFLKWPAIRVLVEMFGFSIFFGAYALFCPRLRPAPPYLFCRSHSSNYDISAL
ncbi:hypothetical protein BGW80DRAFT_508477 [Lactifluus volemus]|nr:hypothetical protein BGW80DRAFT_508477 [Lactifluus volemus]